MKLAATWIRLTITLTFIVLVIVASSTSARAADAPPNVVFLLVDDLGWTDIGCFGSDLYETPNIDALAARGTKFTSGYAACTVCSPTRAAYMTGKYPARLHLTDWIAGHSRPNAKLRIPDWQKWLGHNETTIAEALKSAGYATCHVGKWHLAKRGATVKQFYPERHGFDVNIAGTSHGAPGSYFFPYRRRGETGEFRVGDIPTKGKPGDYLTDALTGEALSFIERSKDGPFFLSFPYYNVHTPIQGKPEYVKKYQAKVKPTLRHKNATYAAMVQSVDDSVGRIVTKLKEMGLSENTVIFFTGDNGGLKLRNITNNVPLRAGKGSSYEGGVRVPTFAVWPGVTKPASECAEPVITCDFYPTIMEIAGAKGVAKHNKDVDGKSLVGLLKDPSATLERDAIFWHYPHYHPGGATPYGAIRAGDWKLVEFYEDMHVELYNLEKDIGEKNDLASSNAAKANELRNRLHQWRAAVDAQMPTANPDHKPTKPKRPKKQ
jgi:arylsulfatase A-like enzyme